MNITATYQNIIKDKVEAKAQEARILNEDKQKATEAFEQARADWFQSPATQFILGKVREEQLNILMRLEDRHTQLSEVEMRALMAEYFTLTKVLRFSATGTFNRL